MDISQANIDVPQGLQNQLMSGFFGSGHGAVANLLPSFAMNI